MTDVFHHHQLKIARSTLKMTDAGARIMGGMTKQEARRFLFDKQHKGDEKKYLAEIKKLEGNTDSANDR